MSDRFHRSRLATLPFTFSWAGVVAFQEVDAAGVVFFATIQGYFHESMVRFLDHAGHPLAAQLRSGVGLAPLVHAEADYRSPLRFGDRFVAGLVDAEVTGSRVTLGFRVEGPAGLTATGHTIHVWVTPDFVKAPLPEALRVAYSSAAAR